MVLLQGVITGISWSDELGQEVANVKLSDEKIKLEVPSDEVLQYVLDQPGERQFMAAVGKGEGGGGLNEMLCIYLVCILRYIALSKHDGKGCNMLLRSRDEVAPLSNSCLIQNASIHVALVCSKGIGCRYTLEAAVLALLTSFNEAIDHAVHAPRKRGRGEEASFGSVLPFGSQVCDQSRTTSVTLI